MELPSFSSSRATSLRPFEQAEDSGVCPSYMYISQP